MAARVSARLTATEGRRFAFPVASAFLVLAGIMWWRDHLSAAYVAAGLSAALGLAGAILPSRLGPVQRGWMALAHMISKVTTPIVMGVIYFVVVTPFGVVGRLAGRNPLRHGASNQSPWVVRAKSRPASMERQF
ncbi:MAG: SxtJ family membrane protein [Gemmatimonadota bacterium]